MYLMSNNYQALITKYIAEIYGQQTTPRPFHQFYQHHASLAVYTSCNQLYYTSASTFDLLYKYYTCSRRVVSRLGDFECVFAGH